MPPMSVSSAKNVNWTNTDNFTEFLANANSSGAGWLFTGIDFMVFFVLFVTLASVMEWEVAMMVSSFIGFVLGLLFAYIGVESWTWVGVFVGLMVVSILYRVYSRNR